MNNTIETNHNDQKFKEILTAKHILVSGSTLLQCFQNCFKSPDIRSGDECYYVS